MEDAERVAVLDRVDELEEDRGDEPVVTDVGLPAAGDHREEVAIRAVVEDLERRAGPVSVVLIVSSPAGRGKHTYDVDDGGRLNDAVDRDDGRVRGRETVQAKLPPLEVTLPGVERGIVEALDGWRGRPRREGGSVWEKRQRRTTPKATRGRWLTRRGEAERTKELGPVQGQVASLVDDAVGTDAEDGLEDDRVGAVGHPVADEVLAVAGEAAGRHGASGRGV